MKTSPGRRLLWYCVLRPASILRWVWNRLRDFAAHVHCHSEFIHPWMTSHNHVKSVQRPDNESVDWNFSHYRNAQAIMLRWCDYRGMDVIPGYFLVVLGNQVTHRVDNAVNIAEVQTHWQEWNEEKNRGFNVHYLFKVKLKVIVIRIFLQLLQLICLYTETKQFNNPLHMLILLVFSSHLSFFNDWCTTPVARSCGGAPKMATL